MLSHPGATLPGGALSVGLGSFFVITMLSGVGLPFEVMTDVMRHVSGILPLAWVTRIF